MFLLQFAAAMQCSNWLVIFTATKPDHVKVPVIKLQLQVRHIWVHLDSCDMVFAMCLLRKISSTEGTHFTGNCCGSAASTVEAH